MELVNRRCETVEMFRTGSNCYTSVSRSSSGGRETYFGIGGQFGLGVDRGDAGVVESTEGGRRRKLL